MIISVLLQPGKSDAGALFTSSVSSAAFGPRGTQTLLAKITIAAAAAFMLVAIVLSLPTLTGSRSVLQSAPTEPTPTPAPVAPATPQPSIAPIVAPATSTNANTSSTPASNTNTAATKNANNKSQPK